MQTKEIWRQQCLNLINWEVFFSNLNFDKKTSRAFIKKGEPSGKAKRKNVKFSFVNPPLKMLPLIYSKTLTKLQYQVMNTQ